MPNSKLIGIMFDTIMLLIAEISKPVISPKTIRINGRFLIGLSLYNRQYRGYRAVFYHWGITPCRLF